MNRNIWTQESKNARRSRARYLASGTSLFIMAAALLLTMAACGEVVDAPPSQEAPRITSIDSNGSVNDQASEEHHVAHHLGDRLVINGENLAEASVELELDGAVQPLTVAARSEQQLEVDLPADMDAETTQLLRVSNQKGGDEVALYVLRGEPGPVGPAGPAGMDGEPGQNAPTISEDTTLTVDSGDCADLMAALRSLDGATLTVTITVTIAVSGGPYVCTEGLIFDHPYGHRIELIGNLGGTATTITFENAVGVAVRPQRRVGLIDGFVFIGTSTDGGRYQGVRAHDNATIVLGSDITVEGFSGACYSADHGSNIRADNTVARQCGGSGYDVRGGSSIIANGAQALETNSNGFTALQNSVMLVQDAIARDNAKIGFSAKTKSSIYALHAEAHDNARHGFEVTNGAILNAPGAKAIGNGGTNTGHHGFFAYFGATLQIPNSIAEDNAGDGYRATFSASLNAANSTVENNGGSDYCVEKHSYLDTDGSVGTTCITRHTPTPDGSYID